MINEKFSRNTWKFCIAILILSGIFTALILASFSLVYSYYQPVNYKTHIYIVPDSWLRNLFFFFVSSAAALLLERLTRRLPAKWKKTAGYLFLGLCCALYTAAGLLWARDLHYYPSGDQLNTTAGAYYNLHGNFSMLTVGGYIGKFPYQKGLMFLYEILFSLFGDFCYPVAAKMHIIMGVITMIFGYLFVQESAKYNCSKFLYCTLLLCCAPYLILIPYAYGDLPSICFCTVLFWAVQQFAKSMRIRYLALLCCMGALSTLMRLHSWIVLIAVIIGLFLLILQKRRWIMPLAAGLSLVFFTLGCVKLLGYSYEARSGIPDAPGAPMVLTLAIGLQDNEDGPGAYNDYQTTVLGETDFDLEAASAIGWANVRENVQNFIDNPSYALRFFKTKIQMQWIEPLFETLETMHSFKSDFTYDDMPGWIFEVFYGDCHNPLWHFADVYQSIVYMGFLFFALSLLGRRQESAAFYIPLIAIVGGFLFSIIWESQGRYVLPYYVFMLLYAPDGILFFGRAVCKTLRRLKTVALRR